MTANELESRTAAAEKDPSQVRKLIAEFKAMKDAQVADLTNQVNAAVAEMQAAKAECAKVIAHSQRHAESAKKNHAAQVAKLNELAAALAQGEPAIAALSHSLDEQRAAERAARKDALQKELDALK